jgi:hypothetical protein
MDEVRKFEFDSAQYKIVKPTNKIRRESDAIYAKAYREAIANGLFLEAEVEKILKERGLDRYSREDERKESQGKIDKLLKKLEKTENKNDGMKIVDEIRAERKAMDEVDSARYELNSQSATLFAENRRFNYYAFACCSRDDGGKIWSSFKEFEDDDSPLANRAASEIMSFIYEGTQEILRQIEKLRPENEWLEKHGEETQNAPVVQKAIGEDKPKKKKTSVK